MLICHRHHHPSFSLSQSYLLIIMINLINSVSCFVCDWTWFTCFVPRQVIHTRPGNGTRRATRPQGRTITFEVGWTGSCWTLRVKIVTRALGLWCGIRSRETARINCGMTTSQREQFAANWMITVSIGMVMHANMQCILFLRSLYCTRNALLSPLKLLPFAVSSKVHLRFCCAVSLDFISSMMMIIMQYKCLANAKRPCDCRVLCLRLKSLLCGCAHSISDTRSFSCRDQGRDSVCPVLWMSTWRYSKRAGKQRE